MSLKYSLCAEIWKGNGLLYFLYTIKQELTRLMDQLLNKNKSCCSYFSGYLYLIVWDKCDSLMWNPSCAFILKIFISLTGNDKYIWQVLCRLSPPSTVIPFVTSTTSCLLTSSTSSLPPCSPVEPVCLTLYELEMNVFCTRVVKCHKRLELLCCAVCQTKKKKLPQRLISLQKSLKLQLVLLWEVQIQSLIFVNPKKHVVRVSCYISSTSSSLKVPFGDDVPLWGQMALTTTI